MNNWKKRHDLKALAEKTKKDLTTDIELKLSELRKDKDENEHEAILSMHATDLIEAAKSGAVTPLKALRAYLDKACDVTMKLNCVVGLVKEAEEQAFLLEKGSSKDEPLYGLPVSIKELINIKGMDTTLGLPSLIGLLADEDAVLVKVLKHNGAIPFVKTNVSQLLMTFGGSNPIYGETGHPLNADFCPGGSSAGEASLVGAGGSPLGFGSDLGGSLRNPAHMCGIASLKPTMNRISLHGVRDCLSKDVIDQGMNGQTLVALSLGPIAKDVDTLVLAMRALLCPLMFELDPLCPPLPFNDEVYLSKKKLRIGYYVTDGFAKPAPAIIRAVEETKEALEKAGHTLVRFDVPRMADAMRIFLSGLFADGPEPFLNALKDCEVDKRLEKSYNKWTYTPVLRNIKSYFLGLKWPRIGLDFSFCGGGDRSAAQLWKLQLEAWQYKEEFLTLWRDQGGLDALICPPFPVASGPLGSVVEDVDKMISYTSLYNLLDFPAGVVPVTKVNQEDIEKLDTYQGHYNDPWDDQIKEVSKLSLGMPVGVQCVALPWQEEMCLKLMKEIESLMH